MQIKVCGMRDTENIKSLLQLPIVYMGFIFYPKSPRLVDENAIKSIKNIDFGEVKKVGVFVNEDEKDLFLIALELNLDYIQLHGDETRTQTRRIKKAGFKVIKAIGLHEGFNFQSLRDYEDIVEFFIFDTKTPTHGGSGQQFDWSILNNYTLERPFLLSGGISPSDVESIKKIKHPQFMGLDLNSKFEKSPALKDIDLLKGFVNELKG